jgi:isopentenyl-diphosphate delta-isomerase
MTDRKKDHIDLAFQSQIEKIKSDKRFYYEPILGNFVENKIPEIKLAGKSLRFPLWISSMTGGTSKAAVINKNLAMVSNEYGFGLGLGSCRIILKDKTYFADFDVRKYLGNELPLFANLGIAQIEDIIKNKETVLIENLLFDLQADGLIIHINPLQEWIQPEGDIIKRNPIDTIKEFLLDFHLPLIIKEVGQGFGPASLLELLKLPIEAIEFGSLGGTNFSKVEIWRREKNDQQLFEPLSFIGHTAYEMLHWINKFADEQKEINTQNLIISGGINSFLDGYYLTKSSNMPAIYGMASGFLKYAMGDYEELKHFAEIQTKGLQLAYNLLEVRKDFLSQINN